jgi:hypothetical protein
LTDYQLVSEMKFHFGCLGFYIKSCLLVIF